MKRLVLVLALVACGPVDVAVAELPVQLDGGVPAPFGKPCEDASQCRGDELCEKPACEAPFGRCVRAPQQCPPDGMAVCGCDGVEYRNDCERRRVRVVGATFGGCE